MSDAPPTPFMALSEVATKIGVAHDTVEKWAGRGRLPCVRVGKEYRVSPAQLQLFLEKTAHRSAVRRAALKRLVATP